MFDQDRDPKPCLSLSLSVYIYTDISWGCRPLYERRSRNPLPIIFKPVPPFETGIILTHGVPLPPPLTYLPCHTACTYDAMSVDYIAAGNDKSIMKETQIHSQPDAESGSGNEVGQVDTSRGGAFGAAAAAGGKEYRVLGRWKTGFVFIQTEVGIGILSLPSVCRTLGLIPGLIAILGIGVLSTYTAYLYLLYWRKHRHIDNLPDAMQVLGGKALMIVVAVGLIVNLSLACASSALTMSVALNTLTGHSMCTVAFVGFSALVCYVLCIPRSMNFVAWFSGMHSSPIARQFHKSPPMLTTHIQAPPRWESFSRSSSSSSRWPSVSRRKRPTHPGRKSSCSGATHRSATRSARC